MGGALLERYETALPAVISSASTPVILPAVLSHVGECPPG
jgi:hypothetical protein